jgi:malate dehydrogenase
MSKVTVVGGGNVGAACAEAIARKELVNEVILLDVKDGVPQGKALDTFQCAPIEGFDTRLRGSSNDYAMTEGSDIYVVTAGRPRGPGMSRDDLIASNAEIMANVADNIKKYSPNAIVIVVANPLDTMTYYAFKKTGFDAKKVLGMAGILDTARYRAFLAEALDISPKEIQAMLLGGHGDTMVPLPRYTTVSGIPVSELIDADKLDAIIERTKFGGGELTKLIGTSAWLAPGQAAAQMVEAIVRDQKRVLPCCVYLDGQYGLKDICVGVPVKLGKNGVEDIIELQLTDDEKALLQASAEAVRGMNNVLKV